MCYIAMEFVRHRAYRTGMRLEVSKRKFRALYRAHAKYFGAERPPAN